MAWLKRTLYVVGIIVLVLFVTAIVLVRRSFPTVDGILEVEGLNAPVEVIRDSWGIPHIYATNEHDLYFAQGYTHAQERFWQMDFWRHIGSGRLAEMFGEGQVDTDRFLRSLGFSELAARELELMDEDLRRLLEAYADGVNAYLDQRSGSSIGLEYLILPLQNSSYRIEPWTPVNTLTWAKLMSWDLSGNLREEIARAVLSRSLPVERVEQLYPPFPESHPVIVPTLPTSGSPGSMSSLPEGAIGPLEEVRESAEDVWALTGGGFEGIGSNSWVIAPELTSTGGAILANDPHLGIQMPSIWFANGLHCEGDCDMDLIGFSFAGTPGIVIGHNGAIAWGVTTQMVDTQDLYIERVNPDDPDEYEVDGRWVPFQVREEVVQVAGGEDLTIEIRSTRHGPVISGSFLDEGALDGSRALELPGEYVVSLAWQSLEPSTLVEAVIGINRASTYEEFREAASNWDIAAQNLVYADIDGNIAYQATGEVPVRATGDGRYPVPGWSSEHEWVGLVPFEELPSMLNPPRGFIETANQPVTPAGSEPFLGSDGAYGYRAARIESLLATADRHTIQTSQAIQLDVRDGGAANLVPHLVAIASGDDDRVKTMQERLETWSTSPDAFGAYGDSNGAAIYQATWRHLLANTFHDEMPEEHWPEGGSRWFEVVRNLLEEPSDPWWDDVTTAERETRDEIIRSSLIDAHIELSELLGDDIDEWTWGRLHRARFENQTFGQSGIAPIEWLFNRTAPPRVGGSTSLVNAVGWDTDVSYLVDWVPSMRMVVDLADPGRSTFIHTTGQSGHAFHRHYDDMIELWTDGEQVGMLWAREQVTAVARATLRLLPSG